MDFACCPSPGAAGRQGTHRTSLDEKTTLKGNRRAAQAGLREPPPRAHDYVPGTWLSRIHQFAGDQGGRSHRVEPTRGELLRAAPRRADRESAARNPRRLAGVSRWSPRLPVGRRSSLRPPDAALLAAGRFHNQCTRHTARKATRALDSSLVRLIRPPRSGGAVRGRPEAGPGTYLGAECGCFEVGGCWAASLSSLPCRSSGVGQWSDEGVRHAP